MTCIPRQVRAPEVPPAPAWWPFGAGVMLRCPSGHVGRLDHEIATDGTVSPSVMCMNPGCDFHDYVTLDEWTEPQA